MDLDVVSITIFITILLISSTLHEAMHAYTSYLLGDTTAVRHGRLSFNPLKHIDPFLSVGLPLILWLSGLPIFGGAKPVPMNPYALRGGEKGMAIVAASGPLTNFILALSVGLPLRFVDVSPNVMQIMGLFVVVNLGFFVFNLLPIPPLDGSRVVYAFSPQSLQAVLESIERQGIVPILIVMVLFSSLLAGSTGVVVQWLFHTITGISLV